MSGIDTGTPLPNEGGSDSNQSGIYGKLEIEVPEYQDLKSMEQLFYYELENAQEAPIFSPDGSTVALSGRVGMGIWTVLPRMEARQNLFIRITMSMSITVKVMHRTDYLPRWLFSPDGSEIYFQDWSLDADSHTPVSSGTANTNPKIKAVNVETGEVRTVLEKAGFGSFNSDCSICVYRKKRRCLYFVEGIVCI